MKTKIIFRKFPDGEVIALFPEIPATCSGWECLSYVHKGQHGPACPHLVYTTRSASKAEYSPLLKELEGIGYDIVIARRFPSNAFTTRKNALP